MNNDIEILSSAALHYALGRMTYVAQDVAQAIIRNVDKISPDSRYKMGEEIANAINEKKAGMGMDVEQWQAVLICFSKIAGGKDE